MLSIDFSISMLDYARILIRFLDVIQENIRFMREHREFSLLSAGDGYRSDMELDAVEDGTMMTKTVIITLGAAAAYMILVVGLMLYCRYRRRRRKQRYLQEQTDGQGKELEQYFNF